MTASDVSGCDVCWESSVGEKGDVMMKIMNWNAGFDVIVSRVD